MVAEDDFLTAERLADRWPRLFHMAEAGSWKSIQQQGLLSTAALLDLFEIQGVERDLIEAARRPDTVAIHHPTHGTAWIRDNKPITESVLRKTLVGMSEADWYRTLNSRVYFWLSEDRLAKLRSAPPYRDRSHDILVFSTELLLAAHADSVELSPLNSGAVHPAANYPRGSGTFTSLADYPWKERCRVNRREPIVELTVPYMVPNPAALVLDVITP